MNWQRNSIGLEGEKQREAQSGNLRKLGILPVEKEKDLQHLVEANLMEVLELHFLATEYVTTFGGRIDTLAVDTDGAPVIIEYKRNRNDNIINQALSYLRWLKTQKPGFFEKLMIDKLGKELADKIKLDWQRPRVICIAETYSKFDVDTVEVVPLRIELLVYRSYSDDIFSLEPVSVTGETSQATTQPATKELQELIEMQLPTIDGLANKGNHAVQLIFSELRERILSLDKGIVEKPTGQYVGYRVSKNFVEVIIQKDRVRLHLRPISYLDPRGIVKTLPDEYKWTLNRRVDFDSEADLDYVMALIDQSYKDVL